MSWEVTITSGHIVGAFYAMVMWLGFSTAHEGITSDYSIRERLYGYFVFVVVPVILVVIVHLAIIGLREVLF